MSRYTVLLAVVGIAGPAIACPSVVRAAANPAFTITVDNAAWAQWGFQYPVTYVFRVSGVGPQWEVRRRDGASDPWTTIPRKGPGEFFNGIQCARIDTAGGKAYISVGFRGSNAIELEFSGVGSAAFDSVAKFYDDRKAAFTLSNDNWGCNPWAHPGAPWRGPTDDASDNYQASLHVCRSFALPVSIRGNRSRPTPWLLLSVRGP